MQSISVSKERRLHKKFDICPTPLDLSELLFEMLMPLNIWSQVGVAVYRRFDTEDPTSTSPPLSYLAHISGSLAGASIGLVILNNFQQKLWER